MPSLLLRHTIHLFHDKADMQLDHMLEISGSTDHEKSQLHEKKYLKAYLLLQLDTTMEQRYTLNDMVSDK